MNKSRLKGIVGIFLSIVMITMLASCGGGGDGGGAAVSNLSGTAEEVLVQLLSDIETAGVETPMPLPPTAVDAGMSQFLVGLSEGDFNRLVISSSYSMAAIATFAHQITVLQLKDSASATEAKDLISADGGFDPHKWICVWPEKVIAVNSGSYVLLVASTNDTVDATLNAFKAAAGSTGTVLTIFEFSGDGGDGFGGGLAIEPLPGG
jgi:hypothetical protein